MWMRNILVVVVTVGSFSAASCSSGGGGSSSTDSGLGGGVGSKCTATSQCTGYAKPTCLTDLKPVENLIEPDAGAVGEVFRSLDIPFPGGYCSNTVEDSCASDADCGPGGGCYIPFDGADPNTITGLDKVVPIDVQAFSKAGLCLVPCTSDADCRTDQNYKCVVPLHAFLDAVNPSYKKTFCIQDVDVSYLLLPAADGG